MIIFFKPRVKYIKKEKEEERKRKGGKRKESKINYFYVPYNLSSWFEIVKWLLYTLLSLWKLYPVNTLINKFPASKPRAGYGSQMQIQLYQCNFPRRIKHISSQDKRAARQCSPIRRGIYRFLRNIIKTSTHSTSSTITFHAISSTSSVVLTGQQFAKGRERGEEKKHKPPLGITLFPIR